MTISIIEQLLPIFRNVFDNDNLLINPSTTAQEVDGWDSLAHIRLIVAIEKFFNIHFSAAELSEIENVGQIAELILGKQVKV